MPKGNKSRSIDSHKVKGLLVGINYRGTSNELGGCINDIMSVKNLIISTYPYAKLELLTDDTNEKPTRDNILRKLTKLVEDSVAGDTLIFQYSGHGSQVKDIHGDEEDGYDETICPIDFMRSRVIMYKGVEYKVDSQIIDDEINEILLKVPRGAKLLMLSDSCHSGTIGDLKNNFLNYNGPKIWENFKPTNKLNIAPSTSTSTSALTSTANKFNYHQQQHQQHQQHQQQQHQQHQHQQQQHQQQQYQQQQHQQQQHQQHQQYHHPLFNQLFNLPFMYNRISENSTINCQASIVYVKSLDKDQIWITPLDTTMYQIFNEKKHIIEMHTHQVPDLLLKNPWLSYVLNVNFNKLSEDKYAISIKELELDNIVIQVSLEVTSLGNVNLARSRSFSENVNLARSRSSSGASNISFNDDVNSCAIFSHYDGLTGKHEHINCLTGQKRTLNMRSPSSCQGGELRIISGCQDEQTSADTGRNGACTLAFLNTVKLTEGLDGFFQKIFSHNVEDLRIVQDNINKFLAKFGFTQQSMVSWDHSTSERNIFGYNNYVYPKVLYGLNNPTGTYNYPQPYNNVPVVKEKSKPTGLLNLYQMN